MIRLGNTPGWGGYLTYAFPEKKSTTVTPGYGKYVQSLNTHQVGEATS